VYPFTYRQKEGKEKKERYMEMITFKVRKRKQESLEREGC
jgi:hypothetical protein